MLGSDFSMCKKLNHCNLLKHLLKMLASNNISISTYTIIGPIMNHKPFGSFPFYNFKDYLNHATNKLMNYSSIVVDNYH